jgi:hypothetical protein
VIINSVINYSATELSFKIQGVQRAVSLDNDTSHEDTEQCTIEASRILDGVTLTDSLIK